MKNQKSIIYFYYVNYERNKGEEINIAIIDNPDQEIQNVQKKIMKLSNNLNKIFSDKFRIRLYFDQSKSN